jgi:hypothetical protein
MKKVIHAIKGISLLLIIGLSVSTFIMIRVIIGLWIVIQLLWQGFTLG